ncbi:MAG: hypothetical protein FWC21_04620 [Treponema sp.]|nr:hypothetical protein [Treponema sp.]
MSKFKVFISAAILAFCVTSLYAFGGKDRNNASPPEEIKIIKVTGNVRLVGSNLMREIVISGDETQWYITRNEMEKLHNLQHQTVTIEGEETIIELTFANGRPAGTRRELKNIKIISIESYEQ